MDRRRSGRQKGLRVNHFQGLSELRDELARERRDERGGKPKPPSPSPPASRPQEPAFRPDSDDQAFRRAMEGVVPLRDKRRVSRSPRPGCPEVMDEVAQVNAYLKDLVDGVVPFDIADTDEFIEGAVQGLDRRLVRRLRRGEYSVQAHIDLHGYTRDEARSLVAKFIKDASARGLRCVLIVHGRGLRSQDQIPVLKEKLKAWLTRGSIGTKVLAFTSAQRYDGGTGAVYVLLRRR